jgi:hypothetical protein
MAVDEFGFEGGEEALGDGVVVAVADAAHRGRDPGIAQLLPEGERGVLAAMVAVVHQVPVTGTAALEGHAGAAVTNSVRR